MLVAQERENAQRRYQALFTVASEAVMHWNAAGGLLNPAAARLLGPPEEDVQGLT